MPSQSQRALALIVALSPVLTAAPARAAGNPDAAVQAMYERALQRMEQKDYATACPALEEVVRRVPDGIGAKLTLAQCYEESGHLATALSAYEVAEAAAAEAKQPERQRKARARQDAIRPRVGKLVVFVSELTRTIPGLTVQCDGAPLPPVKWAVALPADKGPHVITAAAPGKQRWEKTVDVSADGTTGSLTIDGLADAPVDSAKKEEPSGPPSPPLGARRLAGIFIGAAGLIGLAAGSGFGAAAISKKNESNNGYCNALSQCDSTGLELRASGRRAGTAATVLFIAGGVALATGVTLFAIPSSPGGVQATATMGPGGLGVQGRW